jgi:hypothetical protein
MTQEEFIEILDSKGYSYKEDGTWLVVTHDDDIKLNGLNELPSGVIFNNNGNVSLKSIEALPIYIEFRNEGDVFFEDLKSISTDVVFNNRISVNMGHLMGGWITLWDFNVEGIRSNRLLNFMIKKRIFYV